MRIAITGAGGFLGWHIRCLAFARGVECIPVNRSLLHDRAGLVEELSAVDAVLHCAGVNRGSDDEVIAGNVAAAASLADALQELGQPVRVVYANSIKASGTTAYGLAKLKALELLGGAVSEGLSDVRLPNLFGEHGRPDYNSFVATFCRDVAAGRIPASVSLDAVPLMHAQKAAELLLAEAHERGDREVVPDPPAVGVAAVLETLVEFAERYRTGEIPDLTDSFRVQLFHTYRSHLFPARYPIPLTRHADRRGGLVECVRAGDTGGQAFVSTTVPGAVRGEHVHLRKLERFVVVDGDAEIALRRLFTDDVVRFRVSGEEPVIVDMPTMWTHKLAALGERPATTFFWTNELFDPDDPDTYPCPVEVPV